MTRIPTIYSSGAWGSVVSRRAPAGAARVEAADPRRFPPNTTSRRAGRRPRFPPRGALQQGRAASTVEREIAS